MLDVVWLARTPAFHSALSPTIRKTSLGKDQNEQYGALEIFVLPLRMYSSTYLILIAIFTVFILAERG